MRGAIVESLSTILYIVYPVNVSKMFSFSKRIEKKLRKILRHAKVSIKDLVFREKEVEKTMIETWIANVSPLKNEGIYKKYYEQIPLFRQEKADRLQKTEGKIQSVGAWILWMKLREAWNLPEDGVFNLSHSGDYVLCSAAVEEENDVKVGCDIETVKDYQEKMAKRYYCKEEMDALDALSTEEQKTELFYQYWVLKESFMKATRLGMKLDTRTFCVDRSKKDPLLIRQPEYIKEQYYYKEYTEREGKAKIAVCSTSSRFGELKIIEL